MSQREQAPDIESAQLLPRDNGTILTIKNYGSLCRRSWWCVPIFFCCRSNCPLGTLLMRRQLNNDEYNVIITSIAALEDCYGDLTRRMEKLEDVLMKERRRI